MIFLIFRKGLVYVSFMLQHTSFSLLFTALCVLCAPSAILVSMWTIPFLNDAALTHAAFLKFDLQHRNLATGFSSSQSRIYNPPPPSPVPRPCGLMPPKQFAYLQKTMRAKLRQQISTLFIKNLKHVGCLHPKAAQIASHTLMVFTPTHGKLKMIFWGGFMQWGVCQVCQ